MSIANATNDLFFNIVSPTIDLKATGNTIIFTTPANLKFIITSFNFLNDTATSANGDGFFNLGWTAAAYSDYAISINWNLTDLTMYNYYTASVPSFIIPSSTAFRINITVPESGTALTGRITIQGFYIA